MPKAWHTNSPPAKKRARSNSRRATSSLPNSCTSRTAYAAAPIPSLRARKASSTWPSSKPCTAPSATAAGCRWIYPRRFAGRHSSSSCASPRCRASRNWSAWRAPIPKRNGKARTGAPAKGNGPSEDIDKPRRGSRGLWSGAISFSLIHIPVTLHAARRTSGIELDMLDKRDFAPIGYQRYNKATGKTVEWKDIVKGYEYEKGEYVVLTDEDFRRANVEASRTIDIQAFVDQDSIAPYYFETPYFLAPDKAGEKVYALLRSALAQSKKLAIATFVLRSRQHVCALMPVDDVIVLDTLRYESEIQPHPEVMAAVAKAKPSKTTGKELEMALRLVEEMSEKWKPGEFRDTY